MTFEEQGTDTKWIDADALGHLKWNWEIGCSPANDAASANLSKELTEEKAFLLAYAVEPLNDAFITRTAEGIITSWN